MKPQILIASLLAILLHTTTKAQDSHNQEFGFKTDNDLYVSFFLDRYYTNGLELFYKKAKTTTYGKFQKKIIDVRVGQNIYNPFQNRVENIHNQDRPYAGYLYLKYSQQFINDKNILGIGLDLGMTGEKAKGEWAQNFIHQFYGIEESEGWNHQVKTQYSFGAHANYTLNLWHKPESKTQIAFVNNANFNSIISKISSGFSFKFNRLETTTTSIANSVFNNTALQTKNEKWVKEGFFGFKTMMLYQIQDKTLTGELHNNTSQKQFNIAPWVWHNDLAYYWNLKNWNISYHQIFHTQNGKEMKYKWIRYGSIEISYKF